MAVRVYIFIVAVAVIPSMRFFRGWEACVMILEKFFALEQRNSTVGKEIVAGVTTFLTMIYILAANPAILSIAGMPQKGVFAATALTAGLATLFFALYANAPFVSAPGMGLNAFLAITICREMGFEWQEALAMVFLAGVVHFILSVTRLRKVFVESIPEYLRYATSAGLGIFIAYIGIKNAGFLTFSLAEGHYTTTPAGTVLGDSTAFPSFTHALAAPHLVAVIGLVTMIYLLTLESRTGEKYGALLIGIVTAAFVGIPLRVTYIENLHLFDFSAFGEIKTVALSFFGSPGLGSLLADPKKLMTAVFLICILLYTNIIDSLTSVLTAGALGDNPPIGRKDWAEFSASRKASSILDRSLIANSLGGVISGLAGSSTATCYIESGTGIAAGGRTGLTALTTAVLFLLCLPMVGVFSVIPTEAVAPALIVVGAYFLATVRFIAWDKVEQAVPASLTIILLPTSFSILHGFSAGLLAHLIIQISTGKWRQTPVFIYVMTAIFLVSVLMHSLL